MTEPGSYKSNTVAFGSVTASFADVVAATADVAQISIGNDLNAAVFISLGDDSNPLRIPASTSLCIDIAANNLPSPPAVRVKYDTAPSSGKISVLLMQAV